MVALKCQRRDSMCKIRAWCRECEPKATQCAGVADVVTINVIFSFVASYFVKERVSQTLAPPSQFRPERQRNVRWRAESVLASR